MIVVLSDNDTPPPPQRKKRKVGIKIARPEEEMSSFEAALATKLRKAPSDSDEEDRRATRRTDKGKGKAKALENHASEKGPRTSKFGAGLPLATKTVTQSRSLHVSKRKPVPKKHARSRSSTEGSSSDEAPPPVPLLRKKSQAQERLGSPVSSPAAQSHLSIPNVHKRRGLQTKRKPSDHSSDDALPSPASHLRRRSQDSERLKSPILSPAAEVCLSIFDIEATVGLIDPIPSHIVIPAMTSAKTSLKLLGTLHWLFRINFLFSCLERPIPTTP